MTIDTSTEAVNGTATDIANHAVGGNMLSHTANLLRALAAERDALKRWITAACDRHGHTDGCKAVCGPDGDHWYYHDVCNCGRNELLKDKP